MHSWRRSEGSGACKQQEKDPDAPPASPAHHALQGAGVAVWHRRARQPARCTMPRWARLPASPCPGVPPAAARCLRGAALLHCVIFYYSAPYSVVPGCTPCWSRLLGSGSAARVARASGWSRPACTSLCLAPSLVAVKWLWGPFPSPVGRGGGGWENRLLLLVVALELDEEDEGGEDTGARVPALPRAPQAGRPQPSPFPQDIASCQNCGPVACGCARDARTLRGLPPGTTSTTWTRRTPASRSLAPSSTRPRSSAA